MTCPACDQPVREEHGHTRCTGCGTVVETCCEGSSLNEHDFDAKDGGRPMIYRTGNH